MVKQYKTIFSPYITKNGKILLNKTYELLNNYAL